jgi:hypothetical protein
VYLCLKGLVTTATTVVNSDKSKYEFSFITTTAGDLDLRIYFAGLFPAFSFLSSSFLASYPALPCLACLLLLCLLTRTLSSELSISRRARLISPIAHAQHHPGYPNAVDFLDPIGVLVVTPQIEVTPGPTATVIVNSAANQAANSDNVPDKQAENVDMVLYLSLEDS